jgi:hypothetical protein
MYRSFSNPAFTARYLNVVPVQERDVQQRVDRRSMQWFKRHMIYRLKQMQHQFTFNIVHDHTFLYFHPKKCSLS